jgi:hypothetical protein
MRASMSAVGGKRTFACYSSAVMGTTNGSIVYRAHRLRFTIAALFIIPMTVGIVALGYDGIVLGDPEVRGGWVLLALGPLYVWFDFMLLAKLISPPEVDISLKGIRWANPAMLQWSTDYSWQEIEGPDDTAGIHGVPLLQIVVKATGRKMQLPPSHFGATYEEMAAVMSAARAGKLISTEQWRSQHPQHALKHWFVEWGLPIVGGIVFGTLLHGWKH